MTRRLQDFRFDKSEYERPNQKWVCGWAADGRPCRVGPDHRGRCHARYECKPRRAEHRWDCARPERWGGKCADGPLPDGTCCRPIPKCQPVRSLRARRGVVALSTAAFTIGLVLMLFGGPRLRGARNATISPGALSAQHGAIEDCTACHTLAGAVTIAAAEGLGETARCRLCHQLLGEDALKPHGLSQEELGSITTRMQQVAVSGRVPLALSLAALGPTVPQTADGEIACATCHKEHSGRDIRLSEMDNQRCQACHVVKFASFADGHPALTDLGLLPGDRYQFDHNAHEIEHFLDEEAQFTCRDCHQVSPSGRNMLAGSFESMCSDCHADQIERDGLTIFQLPGVDYEVLLDNGISIGEWPIDAGIDLDTEFSPVMRLLLAADSTVADDLEQLAYVDLFFLEGEDEELLQAAGRMVWAIKELFYDLLTNGRAEFSARLEQALRSGVTSRELAALVDQRPVDVAQTPQPEWLSLLRAVQEQWLPDLMAEIPRHRANRPVRFREHAEYEELEPLDDSPWLVDGDFSVRYRPSGHADIFLRRLHEVTGRATRTDGTAAELFAALQASAAPGQCAKCHEIEVASSDDQRNVWTESHIDRQASTLTTFDHAPHLVRQCETCHQYNDESGFETIPNSTCAACHTQNKASESCLNCHSYHTEGFEMFHAP